MRRVWRVGRACRSSVEPVADAPHAAEVTRRGRNGLDLLAEVQDVRVHHAVGDVHVRAPHLVQQLLPGHHLAAVGRVGQSLLAVSPKNWQTKLAGLKSLDWSRSNARLWEGRAMIAGRLSKASSCVVLTANAIKQQLGLPLTTDEAELERQFKKRGSG